MPQKAAKPTRSTPVDPAGGLIGRDQELIRQVEEVCRSWSEVSRNTMHDANRGIATQLVGCQSAEEALAACNGWMTIQLEHLVATQHRLIELWCGHIAHTDGQRAPVSLAQREP